MIKSRGKTASPERKGKVSAWGGTFTSDSRRVVVSGYDRTIRVYEMTTGRELACLDCPAPIFGVAVAPDGKSILASSTDGILRLYKMPGVE